MRSQRPAPPLGMAQVVYAKDMEPTKNWVCHPVSGFLGQVVRLVWWAVVAGARACALCVDLVVCVSLDARLCRVLGTPL